MKVYFPNSAWVAAREFLLLSGGRRMTRQLKVRYGLVIHPTQGPILIDTGYTPEAVLGRERSAMLRLYSRVLSPKLVDDGQPLAVLAQFGFAAADVKTIIVTHFHADHVSGLRQFPNARFIVDGAATQHMLNAPSLANIRHGVFTELLPDDFAARMAPLDTLPQTPQGADILGDGTLIALPLPGHAKGHFGVLIAQDPAPVLYAVDAHWLAEGIAKNRMPARLARLILDDYGAFESSTRIVDEHARRGPVVLAHDPDDTAFDLPQAPA